MNGGTVGNSFVRVDRFVEAFAVEKVFEKLLNFGDPGRTSDENDLMDLRLVVFSVTKSFLDWLEGSSEEVSAKLFESSSGDVGIEINTFEERIDFDGSLSGSREGSFRSFASGSQPPDRPLVLSQVFPVFPFEFLDKVVDESVIEIFTTEMGVTSGGFDFEDTVFDCQNGDIEGTATEIEDEDVFLTVRFLVQTVGNRAAVGSLMILRTLRPAMVPASLVACLWESLK